MMSLEQVTVFKVLYYYPNFGAGKIRSFLKGVEADATRLLTKAKENATMAVVSASDELVEFADGSWVMKIKMAEA